MTYEWSNEGRLERAASHVVKAEQILEGIEKTRQFAMENQAELPVNEINSSIAEGHLHISTARALLDGGWGTE